MREVNGRVPDTSDNACKAGFTRSRDKPTDQTRFPFAGGSARRQELCEDDRQGDEKQEDGTHLDSWTCTIGYGLKREQKDLSLL